MHCNFIRSVGPSRRRITGLAMAAALSMGVAGSIHAAEDYPSRPITLIVPFGPGGTTDLLARLVADGLGKRLKSPVIVENRPGAGGNLGAAEVARARPDGYTLLLGTPGPLAINPLVYASMPFDPARDLMAVSYVANVPNVVLANPATGLKNMHDLLARAKAKPGTLNWGSPGVGSTGHMGLELLKQLSGADITHVPYKGAAQAMTDLIAGHIDLSGDNVPTALENIRSGKVLALGITTSHELDMLPGVKPVAADVPGYLLPSWFAVAAPAGTPKPIVDRLAQAIDAFEREPATVEKFKALGAIPIGGPQERLTRHLASERAHFGELLKNLKEKIK